MLFAFTTAELMERPTLWEGVHRLRHAVFVEEMGWSNLARPDGLEIDEFDHADAVHHLFIVDGRIAGYQRLLPTTRPHLLTHVLHDLCVGTPPSGPDVYEVTRFAVAQPFRDGRRGVPTVGSALIAGFVEWGMSVGADKMIIETEPMWVLRMLQYQFLVTPLGYQRTYGHQQVLAMLLQFNDATLRTLRERRGCYEPVLAAGGGRSGLLLAS
jgi:acyl-homoserine lactone synthase